MKTFTFILAGAVCAASFASAQGMSMGEFEFRNSCAACHGEDARGHGPLEGMLNQKPANLTMLQKNNGGVFPVERMYAHIAGSDISKAHGTRDMPIWGTRYRKRAETSEDYPLDPDEYSQSRILALIEYLSSVQVK